MSGVEAPPTTRLDPNKTWVPLASVIVIASAMMACVWSLAEWRAAITQNTSAIDKLTTVVDKTWSSEDMRAWAEMLKAMNPDLNTPPVHR